MAGVMNGSEKITVKAVYKFKASNNDELSFKKGDIITVTQKEDGGWWEGTSKESGKTGWFPSNYVVEATPTHETASTTASIDATTAAELLARQIENRQQVIRNLLTDEQEFIADLENLQTKYLEPLLRAELLSITEYRQLAGNLDEMVEAHKNLAVSLEEESPPNKTPREQRIGRVLLANGPSIKAAHLTYWSNHPKAVSVLERHRETLDAFMESEGAPKPGLMTLTTGLSKPFRQLDRYASLSQELEQHQEDDHIDRGDAQRSIGYYKNVAAECAKQRRQKEMELEVLTGTIRGWEGDDLGSLGDILHMGTAVIMGNEVKDRHLVLFPFNLLMLSVSSRMSGFIYEGNLPLSGIAVNRLEDSDVIKNSFEITGPMIDRIVVACQTRSESLRWVEILRQQIKVARQSNTSSMPPTSSTSMATATAPPASGIQSQPLPPPHHHKVGGVPSSPLNQRRGMQTPPQQIQQPQPPSEPPQLWKMSSLRPAPPTRSNIAQFETVGGSGSKRNSINVKPKKDPETTYEEDMQILRVIEAYCSLSTAKQRHTFSTSAMLDNLPVLIADEEKLTSPMENSSSSNDDRSIADNLNLLKDEIYSLREQNRSLNRKLEDEVSARKRLESILRCNLLQNRQDIEWND